MNSGHKRLYLEKYTCKKSCEVLALFNCKRVNESRLEIQFKEKPNNDASALVYESPISEQYKKEARVDLLIPSFSKY